MLNKTIRSILSLALVFCLLAGVSGNAIAMAVSNPVDGALNTIDGKVNGTIADLEKLIADLEKEVATQEKNLADAEGKLETGEKDLADARDTLEAKREQLSEAKAKLAEVEGELEKADEMLSKLDDKVVDYQKQLNDAQDALYAAAAKLEAAEADLVAKTDAYDKAIADGVPAEALAEVKKALDDAKEQLKAAEADLVQAQTDKNAYQAKLDDAKEQLKTANEQVDWAKGEYNSLNSTVAEIEGTINDYEDKADEAEDAINSAKDALPKAKTALKEAKEALADAKVVVEHVKTTYATLHNAVTNPEISLEFVRETSATLEAQMKTLWDTVLTLQTSLHELVKAYEELEGFAIDPIEIEDYDFEGLDIKPFEVEEYRYDEIGFYFAGYEFAGYYVKPVHVEGYEFEGFTAPTVDELTEISAKLDDVIAKVTTLNVAMHYYVEAAKPYIAKALDIAVEAVGITYDFLKNNLNKEGAVKAYNWLYNNPETVCNLVKKFGVYGLELLAKYGPYVQDLLNEHSELVVLGMKLTAGGVYLTVTLGAGVLGYVGDKLDFLNDYQDEVLAAARKLYAKYGDEAKALVKVYVDYLNLEERYYNATHADYTVFHDSLYVAIGDSTAVGPDGYVEKLGQLLEIPHKTKNLAQMDLTVEEAIELVEQNADIIGKADLITLGFSNIDASTAMLNALVQDYENGWTTEAGQLVGKGIDKALAELKERMAAANINEEYISKVDTAGELIDDVLNALNQRMVEEGLDEATTNMVLAASEAYLISYVTRMAWYPALVDAVYEINSDAQIVIVGTYNDLEGVVVDIADKKIDMGMIVRALTAVANLENLVQAFVGDECIYVHASAVETVFEMNDYEDLNNMGYMDSILNDEMLPSDAGHAYIAEEIREALNVEYKIWGDVNNDRRVGCRDIRLMMLYRAGLITENDLDLTYANVDGYEPVTARDIRPVMLVCAGLREHYPVCNESVR